MMLDLSFDFALYKTKTSRLSSDERSDPYFFMFFLKTRTSIKEGGTFSFEGSPLTFTKTFTPAHKYRSEDIDLVI